MINWKIFNVYIENFIDNIERIICKLDYSKMKENNYIFLEELCSWVFNPCRLSRIAKIYNITLDKLLEYY